LCGYIALDAREIENVDSGFQTYIMKRKIIYDNLIKQICELILQY